MAKCMECGKSYQQPSMVNSSYWYKLPVTNYKNSRDQKASTTIHFHTQECLVRFMRKIYGEVQFDEGDFVTYREVVLLMKEPLTKQGIDWECLWTNLKRYGKDKEE